MILERLYRIYHWTRTTISGAICAIVVICFIAALLMASLSDDEPYWDAFWWTYSLMLFMSLICMPVVSILLTTVVMLATRIWKRSQGEE